MQALACVLAFLIWALFALWAASGEFQIPSALIVATMASLSIWLSIKVGFWRSIEVDVNLLIIRDYIKKTSVPLIQVRDVVAPGGALVIELENGDTLKPAAFEGSLLTALFGSPSANRAVRILSQCVGDCCAGGAMEDPGAKVSPHLNLIAFPVIWVLVFSSYLGLSFLVS
ncbi:hypothetical protein [Nocardiopsis sp. CNS-639]|uniref:hypothetical protein n=1 Tax=Nocardiopsis sp. CNS-639 TaxID=1169153 RepID=UPI0012DF9598|nr:hypothetical protein [Nocardiopsis sp. CNS-639]